jgi:23S rRNA (uracil1939-C5)-methyltransferase
VIKREPALGFHIPGMFDKVLDIEECWLQPEPSNLIRNEIKRFAVENNLNFFDLKNNNGFLRNTIIRNTLNGEVMIIVVFFEDDIEKRVKLLDFVAERFSQITSLYYVINSKRNSSLTDQEPILYKGVDYLTEYMDEFQFRIGPKTFCQTNTRQGIELYRKVKEFAMLSGNEVVYDLYTGAGTIANYIARHARKVVGIEYVAEAVEDAKVNSAINNITNTAFFAGDMKDILSESFFADNGAPDIIITDPPRAGMHSDVVKAILFAHPAKIIYVSCNPATQARDLQILSASYSVTKVQPVDMFPHTLHVENIVLLETI